MDVSFLISSVCLYNGVFTLFELMFKVKFWVIWQRQDLGQMHLRSFPTHSPQARRCLMNTFLLSIPVQFPPLLTPSLKHKHHMFLRNREILIALTLQKLRESKRKGSNYYHNLFLRHNSSRAAKGNLMRIVVQPSRGFWDKYSVDKNSDT